MRGRRFLSWALAVGLLAGATSANAAVHRGIRGPGHMARTHAPTGPAALSISGTPVLSATQNSPYAGFSVSGSGGTAPYAYSSVGAALPTGVTINVSSGLFAGTPTVSGTFAGIILRVTDNVAATANLASFTLTVAAAGGGCTAGQLDFSCASNSALIGAL